MNLQKKVAAKARMVVAKPSACFQISIFNIYPDTQEMFRQHDLRMPKMSNNINIGTLATPNLVQNSKSKK